MNIFDLTGQFLELQEMLEDPDIDQQMLADTIEGLEGEIEWKADGYAKVIRNMEGTIAAIEIEEAKLKHKKEVLKNSIKRLKENLEFCMRATGKTKFKTDLFSFGIQKNGGKMPIVLDVESTDDLPDDLVRIKEEPDMDAIREYLEKNPDCKYAHFTERGEHLSIK